MGTTGGTKTLGATEYIVQWKGWLEPPPKMSGNPPLRLQEGEEYTIGSLKGDGTPYDVQVYAKNASGMKGDGFKRPVE